jgi:hypothetical protein
MKKHLKQTAQSLIEFALLLPILFLFIMGLFDIGRAIFYYSALNTAAREGTRFAIVQPGCNYMSDPISCSEPELDAYPLNCENAASIANIAICNEIRNNYLLVNDLGDSVITIDHNEYSGPETDVPPDVFVRITITFPFEPITPGLNLIGDFTMNVNSEMMMTPMSKP